MYTKEQNRLMLQLTQHDATLPLSFVQYLATAHHPGCILKYCLSYRYYYRRLKTSTLQLDLYIKSYQKDKPYF